MCYVHKIFKVNSSLREYYWFLYFSVSSQRKKNNKEPNNYASCFCNVSRQWIYMFRISITLNLVIFHPFQQNSVSKNICSTFRLHFCTVRCAFLAALLSPQHSHCAHGKYNNSRHFFYRFDISSAQLHYFQPYTISMIFCTKIRAMYR